MTGDDEILSPDVFHRISNSEYDRTTSLDLEKDGIITGFDDVVQVPNESILTGDHKLLCCGTPVLLSGMITEPNKHELTQLRKEISEIHDKKKSLKDYRDSRNLLEEAQLRYEDDDNPEKIKELFEGIDVMADLAGQLLSEDCVKTLPDMNILIDLITQVMDTHDGGVTIPFNELHLKKQRLVDIYIEKVVPRTPPTTPVSEQPFQEEESPRDTTEKQPTGWWNYLAGYVKWFTSLFW